MMSNVGMFEEGKIKKQVKFLQAKCRKAGKRIKELEEIEKSHQTMNGKLRSELEIEKKNHTLTREDVQAKDLELGRMMKKLTLKDS